MRCDGIKPDSYTYVGVVKGIQGPNKNATMRAVLEDAKLELEGLDLSAVYSAVVSGYAVDGRWGCVHATVSASQPDGRPGCLLELYCVRFRPEQLVHVSLGAVVWRWRGVLAVCLGLGFVLRTGALCVAFWARRGEGGVPSLSSLGPLRTAAAPCVLCAGRGGYYGELKPELHLLAAGDRMYELICRCVLPLPKSCCLAHILEPQPRGFRRAGYPLLHTDGTRRLPFDLSLPVTSCDKL